MGQQCPTFGVKKVSARKKRAGEWNLKSFFKNSDKYGGDGTPPPNFSEPTLANEGGENMETPKNGFEGLRQF